MKLPKYQQAVVAEAKIVKYILNESHPRGKDKAAFFYRFGFSVAQWQIMAQALLNHAATHEVISTLATPEGIHYVIDGPLASPDERNPFIRSIWAVDAGSTIPRFITAYPLKRSEGDNQ
jgi:hypothetical protein